MVSASYCISTSLKALPEWIVEGEFLTDKDLTLEAYLIHTPKLVYQTVIPRAVEIDRLSDILRVTPVNDLIEHTPSFPAFKNLIPKKCNPQTLLLWDMQKPFQILKIMGLLIAEQECKLESSIYDHSKHHFFALVDIPRFKKINHFCPQQLESSSILGPYTDLHQVYRAEQILERGRFPEALHALIPNLAKLPQLDLEQTNPWDFECKAMSAPLMVGNKKNRLFIAIRTDGRCASVIIQTKPWSLRWIVFNGASLGITHPELIDQFGNIKKVPYAKIQEIVSLIGGHP